MKYIPRTTKAPEPYYQPEERVIDSASGSRFSVITTYHRFDVPKPVERYYFDPVSGCRVRFVRMLYAHEVVQFNNWGELDAGNVKERAIMDQALLLRQNDACMLCGRVGFVYRNLTDLQEAE